ncbi:c-type cytochrome [Pendulispora albinea]|uniref:Cytochrome c n=1 Tax=Pendulispora albinea TaxID=2741071 RepID=A0ABZ2M620_9BACT
MKKVLIGIGGLLALAILALVVKFFVLSPVVRAAPDVHAPTSAEAIARGKYLADHVAQCTTCHSTVDEKVPGDVVVEAKRGAGRMYPKEAGFPGNIRALNLTPDKETGIGSWTDGEVLRAMREGIGRDGRALFPLMPYQNFANLTDEDALAIIAYLRSLPAIKNDPGPATQIDFPVSMFIRAAPKPVEAPPPPPPADPVGRGLWLIQMESCGMCHDTMDSRHQPIEGKHLAGGQEFKIAAGTVYASNITSDKSTGIGAYTDEELLKVLNEGVTKNGRPLYLMPWAALKGLTDDDKRAIVAALRTIPPVNNTVPASAIR